MGWRYLFYTLLSLTIRYFILYTKQILPFLFSMQNKIAIFYSLYKTKLSSHSHNFKHAALFGYVENQCFFY